MAFDWIPFLESRHIDYATRGPNVSRGHIAIRCPFCTDDPSQHMSIGVEGQGWRCFRRPDHKGKSPVRLVQALLRCSSEQARQIVGYSISLPDDFMGKINERLSAGAPSPIKAPIKLSNQYKRFTDGLPSSKPYWAYLQRRGYSEQDISFMEGEFRLRYCSQGPFKGRIIFPIEMSGQIVGLTARTIYPDEELRYKTLSQDPESAKFNELNPAHGPISNYLLWHDYLQQVDADTIALVEGPFDQAKVVTLGRKVGIVAACFFTAMPSLEQINLLYGLLPKFKRRYLLLDQGTLTTMLKVASMFPGLNVKPILLPAGIKDPGVIQSREQLLKLFS